MGSVELSVALLDGSEVTLKVGTDKTVGFFRRRATQNTQQKLVLCCNGTVLNDDSMLVGALPSHQLTGWYPRFSASRSDEPTAAAAFSVRAAMTRRQLWRTAQGAARLLLPALRTVQLMVWLQLALWLGLFWGASRVELGGPFLVASALALVWKIGFSDGASDGVSAYTVFNEGMRALPGQLQQEDLQRNVVGL